MDEPGAAPRNPCDVPDGIIRRPAVAFDDRKSSSGSAIGATGADGIDGGADGGAVDEAPSSRAVALLKSNFSLRRAWEAVGRLSGCDGGGRRGEGGGFGRCGMRT